MRPARVGRLPAVAVVVLLLGSSSVARAQFGPPELVPASYLPPTAPGVPTVIVATEPAPGAAKPGDMTKLYEPCLTCDRPVKYRGVRCNKHKGCFQKETLFEWSVGCDPKKNGNGNGNGNGEGNGTGEDASEPEEEDRLASDRPDFTEASSTVGRGRIQLESGYTYFSDKTRGVRTITHSYPEALFRIGMFADWFELRVGQTVFSQNVTEGGVRTRDAGASDLYLGAKLALTKQKGVMPETALILQGTVPSGAGLFTANRVLYGFNYLFGWDLTDTLTLAGSFSGNKFVDDIGQSYLLFAQSLTVGYTITKNLNGYTEWFALYPTGAVSTGGGGLHFIDGGFQYFVTNNFALDIRAGVGLSRSADDFFTGVGFVVRY